MISDLLEMQDDIAAAVAWLAEHWPSGFPVLRWSANSDQGNERPALRLRTFCSNADELARVADLLAVSPADDESRDSLGNQYRRARHRIGRHVEIEALTGLRETCGECGTVYRGSVCPQCAQWADAEAKTIVAVDPKRYPAVWSAPSVSTSAEADRAVDSLS